MVSSIWFVRSSARPLVRSVFLGLLLALACAKPPAEPKSRSKLTQKQFVGVVFDLERSSPAERDAILKRHHTTSAEVRDFVLKNAIDPGALWMAFDSVEVRLDRLGRGAK